MLILENEEELFCWLMSELACDRFKIYFFLKQNIFDFQIFLA